MREVEFFAGQFHGQKHLLSGSFSLGDFGQHALVFTVSVQAQTGEKHQYRQGCRHRPFQLERFEDCDDLRQPVDLLPLLLLSFGRQRLDSRHDPIGEIGRRFLAAQR